MRDPSFWWRQPSLRAGLLVPVAACYGAVAARRMARGGASAGVPVICVGNFTLGGAGKTPTTIAIAKMLAAAGERVFCLSRGYGGSHAGPKRVEANDHAAEVGDEALLLANAAPTIVSRDRVAGARLAREQGASVIVMDDGLQNPSLAKDLTIAVVDGKRGIGNGKVFPAGPLRAPLVAQLSKTDAILVVGDSAGPDTVVAAANMRGLPVLHGRLTVEPHAGAELKGRKALAFAGIGDPEKFFMSARDAGIDLAATRTFADHHRFSAEEAAALIMDAEHDGLALLTTEKDRARMAGDSLTETLATKVHVLPVTMAVAEADDLRRLVMRALRR